MANTNTTQPEVLFDAGDVGSLKPLTAPEPEPVRVPGSWNSPGVSKEGAARAKADEAAAKAAGFSVAPPVYEIGSLVNAIGVENFRASRSEYEAMPSVAEACEKLIKQVASECRSDLVVRAVDLQMLEDGRVTRGTGALPLSERALTGLAGFVTPGGGGYLRECPPDLRAINVNHWLENAYVLDVRATRVAHETWMEEGSIGEHPGDVMRPRELTLRTRTNHSSKGREIFAIVGPKYSPFDVDQIAERVMNNPNIPDDARCEIVYDGYKSRIDVLFHSNVQPEKVVAGEIFKAGFSLRGADDGTGSIWGEAMVWRNLCLNLIIIDHAQETVMRRRHVGDDIDKAVDQGIQACMKRVQYFADAWSDSRAVNVVEKYDMQVEELLQRLVANKTLHVPNVKPVTMFENLHSAWKAEPGHDKTAIVNAVTRAAHEATWPTWDAVGDLERVGGVLLFAKDWNLDADDKAMRVFAE